LKRRSRYQKTWSNSAIQQGGQAHTALALQQRYARDSRNKVYQRWKGRCLQDDTAPARQTPARASLGRASLFYSASRAQSARGSQFPMDTPSKGTGTWQPQLGASGIFARTMPPLREADEDRTPSRSPVMESSTAKQAQPQKLFSRLLPATPKVTSSTTPRGPAPVVYGTEVAVRPGPPEGAPRPAQARPRSNLLRPWLATPSMAANAGSRPQPASAQQPPRFAATQRPLFSTPDPRSDSQAGRSTPPRSLFASYVQRRSGSPVRQSPTKEGGSLPDIYSDDRG
jgi:hypothetical protein